MTVERDTRKLDSAAVFPRTAVDHQVIQDAWAYLNALYESLLDETVPGGSSQLYAGHDHAEAGGAPLINGSQLSYGQFSQPVYAYNFSASVPSRTEFVAPLYTSPGLAGHGLHQEVHMLVQALNADIQLSIDGGPRITVKADEETTAQWVMVQRPMRRDKQFENLRLYAQPDGVDNSPSLKVYDIQVIETYHSSQPQLGARDIQSIASSDTVLRYFDTLAKELAAGELSLHAESMKRWWSALNAMLEATIDQRAPGASSQAIKGHDHYDSGQLGRAIAHGKVYSAGVETSGSANLHVCTPASTGVWHYADKDNGTTRRTDGGSTPGGTTTNEPMWKAYISAGLTSSGSPPSSAPVLHGKVYVSAEDGGADVDAYIENLTTGTVSDTVTLTLDDWSDITNVPCVGDTLNEYVLVVKHNAAVTDYEVYTKGIGLWEAYKVGGNDTTKVSSAGTQLAAGQVSGTLARKVQVS